MLGTEPGAFTLSHTPRPFLFFIFRGSCYVAKSGLKVVILLSLPFRVLGFLVCVSGFKYLIEIIISNCLLSNFIILYEDDVKYM